MLKKIILFIITMVATISFTSGFVNGYEGKKGTASKGRDLFAPKSLDTIFDESEYTLNFDSCKFMVSSTTIYDSRIIVDEGESLTLKCNKGLSTVNCSYKNDDYSFSTPENYAINYNTKKYLYFSTSKEYIALNLETKKAALTHKITTNEYIGSKVCNGTFMNKEENI